MLTGLLRRYALKINLLDVPNSRSSHVLPIPRGGGMAIVLTFALGLVVLYIYKLLDVSVLLALVGSGVIVALIGFLDDHGHVPPFWRLVAHFCAVIWGLAWIGGLPTVTVFGFAMQLGWFGYIVVAVALVWLLNLYNFMDGIDGIAASEAIFIAGSGLIFTTLAGNTCLQIVAILLIGATTGFLIWNWPPAKIFMGDAGSGFLGMILGLFAYSSILNGNISFWSWLIIIGVFLVDATYTLIKRIIGGLVWYEAHRTHAYQHAASRWGHLRVTLSVSLINIIWLLPIAYLANVHREWGSELTMLALFPLVATAFLLHAGEERT